MIRIYFDWNVITELKKQDGGKYVVIKNIIDKYRTALLTPFSNFHVEDLIKNNKTKEKLDTFVKRDLEYLEEFSQCHFLGEDSKGNVMVQIGSPLKFLDTIEEGDASESLLDIENLVQSMNGLELGENTFNFGDLMKGLYSAIDIPGEIKEFPDTPLVSKVLPNLSKAENYWDIMKDYSNFNKLLFSDKNFLREYRLDVQDASLTLPENEVPSLWETGQVMENITKGLKAKGIDKSFMEFITESMKDNKNATRSLHFCTAYLMLDFYGYQSDKLPKPSNSFLNISHDAHHAFLAAHCDIFVTDDKALRAKAKVLYGEFNINTVVQSPKEFEGLIESLIHHPIGTPDDIFQTATKFLDQKNFVESAKKEDEDILRRDILKLPFFYFNYLNYLIYEKIDELFSVLTFRRVFKNYSDFVYYTDNAQLLKEFFVAFGQSNDGRNYEDVERSFVYGKEKAEDIVWSYGQVHFIAVREEDTRRVSLNIAIDERVKNDNVQSV